MDIKTSSSLTCSICYENLGSLQYPKSLPCGQIFCLHCLEVNILLTLYYVTLLFTLTNIFHFQIQLKNGHGQGPGANQNVLSCPVCRNESVVALHNWKENEKKRP